MTDTPLVSIIIVSWNRRDDLLICLESLARLSHRAREILVIDNGSVDGTLEAVHAAHPEVKLHRAAGNTGTSVSRNAAVRLCQGEFIWFLDSDTVVEDTDAIEQFLGFFDDDPSLGGIGGESMRGEDRSISGFRVMRMLGSALTSTEIVSADQPHREADAIATCNLFLTRAVFEAVGGFDALFFHYLEDVDLTWRIKRAGHRLLVGAKPRVDHRFTVAARSKDRFTPKRNRIFFAVKNFSLARILAMPLFDIAYLLAPTRFATLLRYARRRPSATSTLVDPGPSKRASLGGIRHALWTGVQIVLSLPASYILALPHLPAMIAARRRGGGSLGDTDLSLFEPWPDREAG